MEQLLQQLDRLGYHVQEQAIEWTYSLESTKPFMDWLSQSLQGCDALSDEELTLYDGLT